MTLRLLFVDTESVWRGGQEQLLTLLLGLNGNGHHVVLACPAESPFFARAASAGIRTTPFEHHPEWSLRAAVRLRRLIREFDSQVIHVNTPRSVLAAGLATIGTKVVRVASRRVNFPIRGRLSALKYSRCLDSVFTVSASIRDQLVSQGVEPGRVRVVYEGVDPTLLDSIEAASLPGESSGPCIGIIAHLSDEKGHNDLISATGILASDFPDLRCYVVGDGPLAPVVKSQVSGLGLQEQVHFTGFRTDPDAVMKRLDIFCLPSLSEGLSTAVMSAMACRIPVVATTVGSLPELVQDGHNGFLVPPRDPESLADALRKLLQSPDLRRAQGLAGRSLIEEKFTVRRKVEATEREYARLLGPAAIR